MILQPSLTAATINMALQNPAELAAMQNAGTPVPGFFQANALPLAAGLGAVTAGLSLFSAIESNRAVQRSMNSASAAFGAQAGQINASAEQQLFHNRRAREASIGRIVTALAASGGLGGQTEANLRVQAAQDAGRNATNIQNNRSAEFAAARSQYDAQIASLRGRSQQPILSAITGGLGGFGQGLGILQGLSFLEGA
jgi:hypothetical protein